MTSMTRALALLTFIFVSVPVPALQVFNEDVSINDPTPGLIFQDTNVLGEEWYIRGRHEFFSIVDVAEGDVLFLEPVDQSIALGWNASAPGLQGMALGNGAFVNGLISIALGANATAQGSFGTAVGSSASAGGDWSVAIGRDTSAGDYGVAMGFEALADSEDSIAIGRTAEATGSGGLAIGNAARSPGSDGTALGPRSDAGGTYSTALGYAAATTGLRSTAVGWASSADAAYSSALSPLSVVTPEAVRSTAIGHAAYADQSDSIVLGSIPGINDIDGQLPHPFADVAIGTTAPKAPLHIFRNDETRELLYLQSDEEGQPKDRAMMYLENNGGIRFEFRDTNQANGWRFQSQTATHDRFEITKVGTGQIEFDFRPSGNMFIAGNLFTNSDVNTKQDIVPVSGDTVLAKLAELPISEWSYKDAGENRHIGPMAQDFHAAFGLGEGETSLTATDVAGVGLAAVKALNERLEARNTALELRVERLEALVMQLLPDTTNE